MLLRIREKYTRILVTDNHKLCWGNVFRVFSVKITVMFLVYHGPVVATPLRTSSLAFVDLRMQMPK